MLRIINRQGFDVSTLQEGQTIAYQIGPDTPTQVGTVSRLVSQSVDLTSGNNIHYDYILAILPKYVPCDPVVQSRSEVLHIVAAWATGRELWSRLKGTNKWERCNPDVLDFINREYLWGRSDQPPAGQG